MGNMQRCIIARHGCKDPESCCGTVDNEHCIMTSRLLPFDTYPGTWDGRDRTTRWQREAPQWRPAVNRSKRSTWDLSAVAHRALSKLAHLLLHYSRCNAAIRQQLLRIHSQVRTLAPRTGRARVEPATLLVASANAILFVTVETLVCCVGRHLIDASTKPYNRLCFLHGAFKRETDLGLAF